MTTDLGCKVIGRCSQCDGEVIDGDNPTCTGCGATRYLVKDKRPPVIPMIPRAPRKHKMPWYPPPDDYYSPYYRPLIWY